MSDKMKRNTLYSGGLAEIASRPSPLTYSFLSYWITPSRALGEAMKLLGMHCHPIEKPLLVMANDEMYVDLLVEQEALYGNTLLNYSFDRTVHEIPHQKVSIAGFFSFQKILGTIHLIYDQSRLMSIPYAKVLGKKFLSEIISPNTSLTLHEIDRTLSSLIFPRIIAIGALTEFYFALLKHRSPGSSEYAETLKFIARATAPSDWFFTSIAHRELVKNGTMSFEEYLTMYGNRSDKDYELLSPRWHEIPDIIHEQIFSLVDARDSTPSVTPRTYNSLRELIDVCVYLSVLRTESRRIALEWISALRFSLRTFYSDQRLSDLTRNQIFNLDTDTPPVRREIIADELRSQLIFSPGDTFQGTPISTGSASGKLQFITKSTESVDTNRIIVFPNASPEYSLLFPHCRGIIFLRGGQTSHGAIVAREYSIPAITLADASTLSDVTVSINGASGILQIV